MEIGIATLSNLTTSEFKSISAHEFGHFTNQDPFYTRFISQVTASLLTSLAVMDTAGGLINYLNPFYWFYWLYLRAYALLASGFSRSREFLADRRAVLAYGKESFISGLTKAAVDGTILEGAVVYNIQVALREGKSFVNVFDALCEYRKQPDVAEAHEEVLKNLHESKPSWYDSHPSYSERVTAVERFPLSQEAPDVSPATSVLSGLEQIEEELTELMTRGVYEAMQVPQPSDVN
jgi:Zn-dependent protease with chaperone function